MCHQTTCRTCNKVTWSGCGQHKDQVMRGVPQAQRCRCTPAEKAAANQSSLFSRLFGG